MFEQPTEDSQVRGTSSGDSEASEPEEGAMRTEAEGWRAGHEIANEQADRGLDVGAPLSDLHGELDSIRDHLRANEGTLRTVADGALAESASSVSSIDELMYLCDELGRKPRLGLFGKFDSGKSTLANLLLGQQVLPTAYQPETRVATYLHHASDRPGWLESDVMLLDAGFDPDQWASEDHCRGHLLESGGVELLRTHTGNRGSHGDFEAHCAVAFVDSPLLMACTVVDLPGTEDDTLDPEEARADRVPFEVGIFVDSAISFMSQGSLVRFASMVRSTPMIETLNPAAAPLCNLFVVASHAHPGITDEQIREEILPGGADGIWRHLGDTAFQARMESSGRPLGKDALEARMFAFYREVESRRQPLLQDLSTLLASIVPAAQQAQASLAIQRFGQEAEQEIGKALDFQRRLLTDRESVRCELERLDREAPFRQAISQRIRAESLADIDRNRAEMLHDVTAYCTKWSSKKLEVPQER